MTWSFMEELSILATMLEYSKFQQGRWIAQDSLTKIESYSPFFGPNTYKRPILIENFASHIILQRKTLH